MNKIVLTTIALCFVAISNQAQTLQNDLPYNINSGRLLTDMIDTSTEMGKRMLSIYTKYGNVSFSSYIQFQYQYAQTPGIKSYNGGDFSEFSDNRFRMRRARLRSDYSLYDKQNRISTYFMLQFDATERGVNVRDCWGRYYENKFERFHFTAGIFARPFGYELLYSSSVRESLERGRMSQIMMNTERDLGLMFSYNDRRKNNAQKYINVDLGVFNGQGLTGTTDYDGHKDIIGKITLRRQQLGKNSKFYLSGGMSGLFGGIVSQNPSIYNYQNGAMKANTDSNNIGKVATRRYYGVDAQLLYKNKVGYSEFRAEYIAGKQTATQNSSVTPGSYLSDANGIVPLYTRNFNGAYFWYLQHLGSLKHQLVLKYDWYDPNADVRGIDVASKNNYSQADVKYQTFGIGYVYYVNPNLKLTFYFDNPINESTSISGFEKDIKDKTISCRAQFSF